MYSELEDTKNLFKCIKRMLSFGRLKQDSNLISLVYPIINSQLGILYNMCSQLKTIMKVIKTHTNKKINTSTILHQLDSIRFKLQDLIFIDYNFKEIYDLITLILSPDFGITYNDIYIHLDKITHDLLLYINQETKNKMINAGLYPIMSYLVPDKLPF